MDRVLGIVGGMGPLATVKLLEKIVMLTDAKCDQEHLHILVDNNTLIPDRTSYLIGSGEDPRGYLIHSAKLLCAMGANYLIMPCNTAHYFYSDIVKEINIPFLHMIEETAREIIASSPQSEMVGLLATEGTCKTGVYDDIFRKYGLKIIKPSIEKQRYVSSVIYGIKENREIDMDAFHKAVEELEAEGCESFILGCTELSVLHVQHQLQGNFVDPMDIIARSAIRFGGKKVKDTE
ncbi:MAG: cysteate racemase [Clostridia bacterium]